MDFKKLRPNVRDVKLREGDMKLNRGRNMTKFGTGKA